MDQVLCSFAVLYWFSSLPRPVVTILLVDQYNASLGAVDVVVLLLSPVSGKQHLTAGYDIFSQVTTSIHGHWLQKKWLTAATGGTGIIKSRLFGPADTHCSWTESGIKYPKSGASKLKWQMRSRGNYTKKLLVSLQSLCSLWNNGWGRGTQNISIGNWYLRY